jgi:hypothetical protein
VARRVRAAGGRIAVHCQDPDSSRAAVAAGVDSIEHGQHLDPSLLDRMAAGGVALVPTLSAFQAAVPEVAAREPSERRDRWLAGTAAMGPGSGSWPAPTPPTGTAVYDRDPRAELGVLDSPVRVILRGRVVR